MSDLFSLAGKTALVTGAGGGLGSAIALAMAEAGARVIVSDLTEEAAENSAARIKAQGRDAWGMAADMADPASRADLIARAEADAGTIDVLICNAGVEGPVGPITEATPSEIGRTFEINLDAALDLASRIAPGMRAKGDGTIILMASIAGLRGNGAIGTYGLTKAALMQLARNLAVELGPSGIRTNAIAPGLIETPFSQGLMGNADFMRRRLGLTPLRRVGQPHEIAGVAVMLASRAGGFINGQTIVVDGGTVVTDGS